MSRTGAAKLPDEVYNQNDILPNSEAQLCNQLNLYVASQPATMSCWSNHYNALMPTRNKY